MSTIPDTDELQNDDDGYLLAMQNMDASSPAVKMIGEELEVFLSRSREKLNEITNGSVSEHELSKAVIKLISFRLGKPTARTIMSVKRSPNAWNIYLRANYESVKSEMRISLFLNVPSDSFHSC
jgi:hypothetical protein